MEFETARDAKAAIAQLDGVELDGMYLPLLSNFWSMSSVLCLLCTLAWFESWRASWHFPLAVSAESVLVPFVVSYLWAFLH